MKIFLALIKKQSFLIALALCSAVIIYRHRTQLVFLGGEHQTQDTILCYIVPSETFIVLNYWELEWIGETDSTGSTVVKKVGTCDARVYMGYVVRNSRGETLRTWRVKEGELITRPIQTICVMEKNIIFYD